MEQRTIQANTKEEREKLFIRLYETAFPTVARYVQKMGGDLDEARDVFQDALVAYYERSAGGHVPDNEKGYLLGIAKYLWIKRYRENLPNVPFDDFFAGDDLSEATENQPSTSKLLHYLETAGQKCMELLKSFYYDKLPATDIAELFGFSGSRSATVQKYKCLEKVRNTVKEKALVYEDFLD